MDQLLIPSSHAAGYSNIPVAFRSDNATKNNFQYIINICWNRNRITSMSPSQFNGTLVTTINTVAATATSIEYKLGDKIFIYDGVNDNYKGYYTILNILSSNVYQIDLEYTIPLTAPMFACNYYNYKMPQDPQGIVKLDLANTLKDFVSSTIKDNFLMNTPFGIYDGSSTRFEYFIVLGEEYKYELRFEDNGFFTAGTLGFYNTSITSLSGIPFKVGDKIFVQQDLFEWTYTSIVDESGRVRINSSNPHNWEVGDLVNVTGQITHQSYNGNNSVFNIPNSTSIVIDNVFLGTSSESGVIFGTPKPEYNRDFTITNIYIDVTLGLVIETDGTPTGASQPIPGTITYLYDTLVTTYVSDIIFAETTTEFSVFDARIDRKDFRNYGPYTKDLYKDNFTLYGGFGMSTILDNKAQLSYLGTTKKPNRIDYTTKSFLLLHSSTSITSISMKYTWYDREGGTILGYSYLDSTLNVKDIYVPIGIVQLMLNNDRVDSVGFDLSTDFNTIKYYTVVPYDTLPTNELAIPIKYKIDDCERGLDAYTLIWKDALGSWISYPFKYVATESTDVTRSNYYRREGEFVDNGMDDWSFDINNVNRGETTFNTQSRNKFKLTSGWVNNNENILFEDLIKSTEVFLQLPSYANANYISGDGFLIDEFGDYITDEFGNYIIIESASYYEYIIKQNELVPVVLDTTSIEYGNTNNFQIYNYSPTVRVAYNDYRF